MDKKDKIINMIYSLLSFIIIILIVIFAIYAVEKKVNEAFEIGYENGKINTENQMFDDWLDLYGEYYELYVDYKVLEERLKHQPSDEEYVQQILDDMELVVELLHHYHQENITTHSFGDWLQLNYPELYERVLNYY